MNLTMFVLWARQTEGKRKSRAIHLLPLWAFVACSRANFTFYNEIMLFCIPLN